MRTKHHMTTNIEGLLRNFKNKKINFIEDETVNFRIAQNLINKQKLKINNRTRFFAKHFLCEVVGF